MSSTTQQEVASAYKDCARITRAASTNFYVAFLALPSELRRAIYSTYAFCRLCDDIVDEPVEGADPRIELNAVADALDRRDETKYEDSPIFVALDDAIHRFELDKRYYVDVIDGCRMDIDTNRYETFDDLSVYCKRVASAVGVICVSIFGYSDETAIEYANDLGIAFQLTNILRDIREDYSNGRVYLPQEDLRRFGVSDSEFSGGPPSDNFRAMMRYQMDRAFDYYERGERVIPMAVRGRQCLELMSGFYYRILQKIERCDGDVLTQRVSLSPTEKLSITAGIGWRSALRVVSR